MALFPSALVDLIRESSSDPEETLRALRRRDLLVSTVDDAEVLRLIREALAECAAYVRTSPYDDKGPGHFVAFALLDAGVLSTQGRIWLDSFRSERQSLESRPKAGVRSPPSVRRPVPHALTYPRVAQFVVFLLMAVALILKLLGD